MIRWVSMSKEASDLVNTERDYPCQGGRIEHGEESPFGACFFFDGGDGCHAGKIYQDEEHETVCHQGGEYRRTVRTHLFLHGLYQGLGGFVSVWHVVKDAHGADYNLFGGYACDDADAHFPVKAQWLDGWLNGSMAGSMALPMRPM